MALAPDEQARTHSPSRFIWFQTLSAQQTCILTLPMRSMCGIKVSSPGRGRNPAEDCFGGRRDVSARPSHLDRMARSCF